MPELRLAKARRSLPADYVYLPPPEKRIVTEGKILITAEGHIEVRNFVTQGMSLQELEQIALARVRRALGVEEAS